MPEENSVDKLLNNLTSTLTGNGASSGLKLSEPDENLDDDDNLDDNNNDDNKDKTEGKNKDKNKPKSPTILDADKHKNDLLAKLGKIGDDDNDNTDKDNDNQDDDDKNEVPPLKSLMEEYGYVGEDYDKHFEGVDLTGNTLEDIKAFNEKRDVIVGNQAIEGLIEARPEVGSLLDHLEAGKSVKTWLQREEIKDYSKIQLSEDNTEQLEQIVKSVYESRGLGGREIKVLVDDLKDNKLLFEEAKNLLSKEVGLQKAKVAAEEQKEVAAEEVRKNNIRTTNSQISKLIDGGKINGMIIPENERKELKQLALSDKSRGQLYDSLSIEQSLFLDIIAKRMKDGKSLNLNGVKEKTKQVIATKKTNPMSNKNDSDDSENSDLYIDLEGLKKLRNNRN